MKVLIIYDSLFGNTGKIAQSIASGFGANQIQILKVTEATPAHFKGIDLLLVGSPTHGGRPSQPTQQFFNRIGRGDLNNIPAAAFDTGIPIEGKSAFARFFIKLFGYADRRIARMLQRKGAVVVDKQTFYVTGKEGPLREGELERARNWAGGLLAGAL